MQQSNLFSVPSFLSKQFNLSNSRLLAGFLLAAGMLFVFSPADVFAQNTTANPETINVKPAQQFYEPRSTIEIEVLSRLINLKDKKTTWSINGEVVESGTGITSITAPTGSATDRTTVEFQVILPTQGVITRKLTLKPTEVDIIWEAIESYVPPFYKGKALNPGWGRIQVTAIPQVYRSDGTRFDPDNLIYEWEYNSVVYGNKSGRGRNSLRVNTTPRDNRVNVSIKTPDDDLVAQESITLPRANPEILLYEVTPDRGTILARSLENNINREGQSVLAVTAQPYYFLTDNTQSGLNYRWNINDQLITNLPTKDTVYFRPDQADNFNVNVEISDSSHMLFPAQDRIFQVSL